MNLVHAAPSLSTARADEVYYEGQPKGVSFGCCGTGRKMCKWTQIGLWCESRLPCLRAITPLIWQDG
jgi:hypothetical protein